LHVDDRLAASEGKQQIESEAVPHFEVAIVVLAAYASYVVAEDVRLSGIMSLFFCGTTMSHYTKYNLSLSATHVAMDGVKTAAFLAEAAVFTYLGLDFVLVDFGKIQWRFIALVIGVCLVSRACNVFPMSLLANSCCRRGRKIQPRSQVCRCCGPVLVLTD
jgi:sodium/hydrogen exchanger 8